MPSGTLLLHIGTHKTGTSSLQTMVARNPEHFSAQGLYYPAAGRFEDGHHNLAWELTGDDRFRQEAGGLTDLCDELDRERPRVALVSSEDFECLYGRTNRLTALRQAIEDRGYGVYVVVTLREPAEYILSLYAELRSHGLAQDLDTFVATAVQQRCVLYRDWDIPLDYSQLIDGFAAAFGPEALRVLAYDPLDSVTPVLQACSEVTGVALTPIRGWVRANTGAHPDRDALSAMIQRDPIDRAFGGSFQALGVAHEQHVVA